ncbi:MAG: chemotaxis protein CheX [Desulfofustis sp.]|nr:chemotaxis protein CheX [Desulfofustis sp.]
MDIKNKIIESTQEIFSSMVMMEIAVVDSSDADQGSSRDGISGIIGLAGTHKGVLAIHIPAVVAMAITGSFLGMDVEQINEDVEDAVGELANMLGGNIKTILSQNGRDIELSLPTTISGQNYDFQTAKDVEVTRLDFTTDSGTFTVELQLEK